MPARLYAFVPEEQNLSNAEREQLIEGLERELDEYYEQKCGKGSLETYLTVSYTHLTLPTTERV